MKNTSIRVKMTLWHTLALVAVAAVTVVVVLLSSRMTFRRTINEYLVDIVESNAGRITFVPEMKNTINYDFVPYKEGYLRIDDDFEKVMSNVHSIIYAEDGTLLYGSNPIADSGIRVEFEGTNQWHIEVNDMRYNIYDRELLRIVPGESIWIRGIVSEEENVAQFDRAMHIALLLLPLVILIAALIGYVLSGRVMAPIKTLEKTAREISNSQDLKRRIDVDDQKGEVAQLAQSFNGMMDRLEQSFESERQFTSDVSHELRTPMAVINAQTEYILAKERSPEAYRSAFEIIQKQGHRMDTLVNDMLEYTRIDQSSGQIPMEEFDLSAVAEEVVFYGDFFGKESDDDTLPELSANITPGIRIYGNATLIARLMENLLSNAFRYSKENGHVSISLTNEKTAEDETPVPVLTVQDDGIGIEASEQERIFDRLYRGSSVRNSPGSGLGLSMVRRIADIHGAKVELRSRPGEGSTFRVIFSLKINKYAL